MDGGGARHLQRHRVRRRRRWSRRWPPLTSPVPTNPVLTTRGPSTPSAGASPAHADHPPSPRGRQSSDGRSWRQLRRAALADAPGAFASTLAQWSGTGDVEARWRAHLREVALNLVLVVDGQRRAAAGMVSATAPKDGRAVELISLWVAPRARGHGVGDAAVREVLQWARQCHPHAPVVLAVTAGNEPAARLYRRHGFTDAGPSPHDPGERLMRHQ